MTPRSEAREILNQIWASGKVKDNAVDLAITQLIELVGGLKKKCERKHIPEQMSYCCQACDRIDIENAVLDSVINLLKE